MLAVAAAVAMIINVPNEKGKREAQIARAPVKQAPPATLSAPPRRTDRGESIAVDETKLDALGRRRRIAPDGRSDGCRRAMRPAMDRLAARRAQRSPMKLPEAMLEHATDFD